MTVDLIMENQNLEITMWSTGLTKIQLGLVTGSNRMPQLHYWEDAAEFPEKAEVLICSLPFKLIKAAAGSSSSCSEAEGTDSINIP